MTPSMRRKSRLTITLSPDLVAQLDRMIDRRTIRSRSHAVEMLLRQTLKPAVSTAILLAGGKHEKTGIPALAPIGGQALISLTIGHLVDFGIRTFVVLAGRDQEEIETLMGSGQSLGVRIHYLQEERPLGTAGAVKRAQELVGDGPFLVVNADILTDIDIADFIRFHVDEGSLATIAVKPRQAEQQFGKVMLQGNRITAFNDRAQEPGISIVNSGLYLFQPEVLDLIEPDRQSMLETDVFPLLARMGELSAFLFQGIWYDVRSQKDYRIAQRRWQEKGGFQHVGKT